LKFCIHSTVGRFLSGQHRNEVVTSTNSSFGWRNMLG